MAFHTEVTTTFEPTRVIEPLYTGGSVSLSEDGTVLATCLGEDALLTDLATGRHLCRIAGDGEPLTSLSLSRDASWLVSCSRSLYTRIYALRHLGTTIEAKVARTFKPHLTPVVASTCDSTSSLLATGGADGEIKVWDLRGGYTTHTFHGHSGIVTALHFFEVVEAAVPKAKPKGKAQQSVSDPDAGKHATIGFRLASGGEDGKIRIWNLHERKSIATLVSHASVVRSLDYSAETAKLLSGSRDRTAIIWDAKKWQIESTFAVLEGIESAAFLGNGAVFFTGGENGRLRLWSSDSGAELTQEQSPGIDTEAILQAIHFSGLPFILTAHADQTLVLHEMKDITSIREEASRNRIPPLQVLRRISGTHDEVIDLAYVGLKRNMLALATNLEEIRLISLDQGRSLDHNSAYFGADVATLKGHQDIVITIDTDWSGCWLATGAKDNTARLWKLDQANDSYTCFATFTGHAESISAVALPSLTPPIGSKEYNHPLDHPPRYLITGSQDKTIKRWDITHDSGKSRAKYTRKAHDKDINAIETSFSNTSPLFASASQDRTVKIWDTEVGEAVGVLRGHKRGVWTVAFSPPNTPSLTTSERGGASSARGMVLTGSGDKSVRIWSLVDFSCLRTFEGHTNSVLKVVWLPSQTPHNAGRSQSGARVASAAGDGLVKVWDAQSSECAATLDNHIDRVWALAVKPPIVLSIEEQENQTLPDVDMDGDGPGGNTLSATTVELVSGSADSTLTFWTDTTAVTAQTATAKAQAYIEQDQALQNHMRSRNYREAIVLALQLNHPKRLLDLFTSVTTGPQDSGSLTGKVTVDRVLAELSNSQLWSLLLRLRDWNANARTHNVAQHILHAILKLHSKEKLLELGQRHRNTTKSLDDGDASNRDELADAMASLTTKRSTSQESIKDVLDALRVYTERHYTRLEKTSSERFVLAWALQQMGDGFGTISEDKTNGYYFDASAHHDVILS